MMMPEWFWSALSGAVGGAAGVIVTLKVAMARLETSLKYITCEIDDLKDTLKHQVGDARCDKMRQECQGRIEKACNEIKLGVSENRTYVAQKFEAVANELKLIAVWMAKHNGD